MPVFLGFHIGCACLPKFPIFSMTSQCSSKITWVVFRCGFHNEATIQFHTLTAHKQQGSVAGFSTVFQVLFRPVSLLLFFSFFIPVGIYADLPSGYLFFLTTWDTTSTATSSQGVGRSSFSTWFQSSGAVLSTSPRRIKSRLQCDGRPSFFISISVYFAFVSPSCSSYSSVRAGLCDPSPGNVTAVSTHVSAQSHQVICGENRTKWDCIMIYAREKIIAHHPNPVH